MFISFVFQCVSSQVCNQLIKVFVLLLKPCNLTLALKALFMKKTKAHTVICVTWLPWLQYCTLSVKKSVAILQIFSANCVIQ